MIATVRKSKRKYLKAWLLTTRPKTLVLSVIPFLVGTLIALPEIESINIILMLFAIFSALFIQIGTNFINDVYDFKNNADKPTRLGPKRGIQSGVLTSSEVLVAGMSCFALSLLLGIPLALKGGFVISLILLTSVCCGYFYTGGPKPLAYNGLGELFVIIFFGFVSTTAAYFLQTGHVSPQIWLISAQAGAFAAIPIAINNLRDIEDDTLADKKTLAVRFGKNFARIEITFLILLPYLLGFYFSNPWMTYLPWVTLPLAYRIINHIWAVDPSESLNKFLALSILLYLLFTLLLTLGFYM